jgi:hypothetical protein
MNKAEIVFNKISKCKKKKGMTKKAFPVKTVLIGGAWLAPKPRQTALDVQTEVGKNIKMKNLIKIPKK